jgi:chromosome segregation ATPase
MKTMNMGIAGLVAAALAFTACSNQAEADRMEQKVDNLAAEFEANKHAAVDDLRELRDRLADHLETIDTKLEDAKLSVEERTAWETRRTEAAAHVARVDAEMGRLERATANTWEDVKQGVSNTARDVGDWFTKQVDKIDEKTEADHDQDGK